MATAVQTASSLLSRAGHNGSSSIPIDRVKEAIQQDTDPVPAEEPEVDIVINNVVCSFNVRCHLNLRDIALKGLNVEYRKENGVRVQAFANLTK